MVSPNRQIILLALLLSLLGFGAAAYKHFALGFPLLASQQETVWQVEASITFEAGDSPIQVMMNLPDSNYQTVVESSNFKIPGYGYSRSANDAVQFGHWQGSGFKGEQQIYFRAESLRRADTPYKDEQAAKPEAFTAMMPRLAEEELVAARLLLANAEDDLPRAQILSIVDLLNRRNDENAELLLQQYGSAQQRNWLAGQLLTLQGYAVEVVGGIELDDERKRQSLQHFLDIQLPDGHLLVDTRELAILPWHQAMLFKRGNQPLLEVFGGTDSTITFATVTRQRAAFTSAVEAARVAASPLVDFSIYSLPLAEQSTFKLLLVIPLGALVVVILRNLIGVRTSGTFMPVLIALSFLQTSLLTGLILFVLVVGVGLVLRSYLSHLNLLLVPRIASVLVFVIIIYAAIGILSSKLGWQGGLKVTFFPMIILAWTIERMSILWDEEGGREVAIQGGGSLITACLAYLLMASEIVADTVFLYPELLLVLLAIIIAIGSYSGYRLSDLRRFESMERY